MVKSLVFGLLACVAAPFAFTSPATDSLLEYYQRDSQVQASISEGKQLWFKSQFINGQERSCTTCHGLDLTLTGKHQRTMKLIEPMSLKVNNKRYMNEKKIEKWFKRNCKWAWGRECTSQEKSDILMFLLAE